MNLGEKWLEQDISQKTHGLFTHSTEQCNVEIIKKTNRDGQSEDLKHVQDITQQDLSNTLWQYP